jgi:uncharacterized RDD family membrane protein YckC
LNAPASLSTPSLRVRFACMVYEALLLFGVLFLAGWLFSTLLQQRHALYLRDALQYWLLLVLALYFAWFWSHGGQTLAMKTWRVRLERADGRALGFAQALLRYALAWLWFLPGLLLAWLSGAHGWMLVAIPAANALAWAATAFLDPQRQFLHDRLAKTRLVRTPLLLSKRGHGISI